MATTFLLKSFVFVFMFFTRIVVMTYTVVTLPLYYVAQKPWRTLKKARSVGGKRSPNGGEWTRFVELPPHPLMGVQTINEAFDMVLDLYPNDKPALGYREVLAEEIQYNSNGEEIKLDGKVLRKYKLSDYKWLTLAQVAERIHNISKGLLYHGLVSGQRAVIYMETCAQYFLSSAGIAKMGGVLVTAFHTLSDEGLLHALNETKVTHIFTSFELISRVSSLIDRLPHVTTIIYFEGPKKVSNYKFKDNIKVITLAQLENDGKEFGHQYELSPLSPDDVCMIMYTSGTSGLPKGVIGTQRQVKEAAMAMGQVVRDVIPEGPRHTYIAYLPQAHILEATIEIFLFCGGVKIGYATPFTLNESAPGLVDGQICDLQLLRPTIMTTVPLVLDRIRKEMYTKLASRTPVSIDIFNYLIKYKTDWIQRGYDTPIVNTLLCGRVRQQLGGKLEYMVVGSAPLSPQLQSLIKCSLNTVLVHGYGTTETCGAVLATDFADLSFGRVGAPLNGVNIKLIDWEDGGYRTTDQPNPRGEIVVGGKMVSNGYYEMDQMTKKSFSTDADGVRWFYTGDIGEVFPDGTFKIIDRKKDLIKLANGEFISLGKIEAALKNCPYVDNICVCGDAIINNLVALVMPNIKSLAALCKEHQLPDNASMETICANERIKAAIHKSIIQTGFAQKLHRIEIPVMIHLCHEEWTPDSGLLTAAMKLKRNPILHKFRNEVDSMFDALKHKPIKIKCEN